jgi:hypothetical protein
MTLLLKTPSSTISIAVDEGDVEFDSNDAWSEAWDNAVLINCSRLGWKDFPRPLPKSLQVLVCDDNRLSELPVLPPAIRDVQAKNNRISTMPDMRNLTELENVDLSGNSIYSASDLSLPVSLKTLLLSHNALSDFSVTRWPEHMVQLTLSYNRLTQLDPSFDHLNESCNVNLAYNDFPCQKYNAFTFWIGTDDTEENREKSIIAARFQRFGIPVKIRNPQWTQLTIPPLPVHPQFDANADGDIDLDRILNLQRKPMLKSLYNDPHNVHARSVQKSTNESIEWLLRHGDPEPYVFHHVKRQWKPKRWWSMNAWRNYFMLRSALESLMCDPTIHSVHGITCKELLGCIWNVIKDHPNKQDILDIMADEVRESTMVCFTGKFTRILNSLNGFFDEVRVSISSKEQMQNRIVQALKKVSDEFRQGSTEYEIQGKAEVLAILKEFNVPEEEHEAWLDAV